ncbi:cilia- and flagella-associated protein 45 isoform X2 [Periophthalmus magnuspinnatus]|uniref:cilia- and flagella-associated protein 45 isoform X2 n=1 Tax=Periophthalmus magnuspinnatus TaxID=409849 RepID=UPI0024369049|nr:cilia- and flagella-associated protein 45 isoform X2 [Periophthalmus magnuspinnatus]
MRACLGALEVNQSQIKTNEIAQHPTQEFVFSLTKMVKLFKSSPRTLSVTSALLEQTKANAQVLTDEEIQAMKEASQRKKEEEIAAAEEKKRLIIEADLSKLANPTLTEEELEAQEKTQRMLDQAHMLRMEQEDEIKRLNRLILEVKCQASRDAQMQEKAEIQTEMSEEEKRLDTMMEAERRKALETMEKIDELHKMQRYSGMQEICNQIREREEERQFENELKELEKLQLRKKQEMMNLEDLQTLEKKKKEQEQLQEEIRRINAETLRAKEKRKEEEKLADLRAMEYIKEKMEREAKHEAEQRQIKREKELEIARLRARQEKAKDYQAKQDEIRARRNQEIMDREWRRKEKELALKKASEQEMLKAARAEQVQYKEHFLSIEAGREKAEFERVLKVQQEAITKEKEEEEKFQLNARRNAEAIRQQVKDRELSAIAKRREMFKDAEQLSEEARLRRLRLSEIKAKKLNDLRATGLCEKYCSEVERKAGF